MKRDCARYVRAQISLALAVVAHKFPGKAKTPAHRAKPDELLVDTALGFIAMIASKRFRT